VHGTDQRRVGQVAASTARRRAIQQNRVVSAATQAARDRVASAIKFNRDGAGDFCACLNPRAARVVFRHPRRPFRTPITSNPTRRATPQPHWAGIGSCTVAQIVSANTEFMRNSSATQDPPARGSIGMWSPSQSGSIVPVLISDDVTSESSERVLRDGYATFVTRSVAAATRLLPEVHPAIIVTELVLPDGDGVEICRAAVALPRPPLVIATTAATERVPAALIAGCHAVLLKPYSPNLLCARIGRLLRTSDRASTIPRTTSHKDIAVSVKAAKVAPATTNRFWNDMQCPGCGEAGATSFDFASHRQMWCACLTCHHVWVARRRE
jgi:CheY-like chemotaxis protein